jgi:hypothetical protein
MQPTIVFRAFSEKLGIEWMKTSLYDNTVTDAEKITLVDDKKTSGV